MMFALPAILQKTTVNLTNYVYCQQSLPTLRPITTLFHLKGDGNYTDSSGNNIITTPFTASSFSSSVKKYGTHSMQFTANNSYITADLSPLNTTGNNLTIEFWIKAPTIGNRGIFTFGFGVPQHCTSASTGNVNWISTMSSHEAGLGNFSLSDSWQHIAIVVGDIDEGNYTNAKLFLDGQYRGRSSYNSYHTNFVNSPIYSLIIGTYFNGNYPCGGYIDSFRISKGKRYLANFNPETDTGLAY